MASLRPGDIKRFIAAGCKSVPMVLVFGPDEGTVRTRIREMVASLLGPEADPLSRVDLDAETLNKDPGRLFDEANAIGMFGGRRVIVVSSAGRVQKSIWQALLDEPPRDATVLFQADDLAKTSPLRQAFEKSPTLPAIPCYPPSQQDLAALIDERTREAGISITPTARAHLAELLGSDLALSESEIDKLILYCRDRLTIDIADIDAMIADSSAQAGSEPIDRAFEGKLEDIEGIALRSFREGINPAGLLVLALNHAIMLKRLALSRSGGGLDSALRSEGLFFRRIDRVRAQAMRWELPMIGKAIETLAVAQDQSRKTAGLEETITIRALWSIALASRRR